MVEQAQVRGNIGEWSELYALAYLLVQGGAYSANEKQEPIPDLYYKVLQVIVADHDLQGELRYDINDEVISIFENGYLVNEIEKFEIKKIIDLFLADLIAGKGKKTFSIPNGQRLMKILNKRTISAGSSERETDLSLVIADTETGGVTPKYGFSIKSQLGGASTLLNSSRSTNIIYEVIPNRGNSLKNLPDFSNTPSSHPHNVRLLFESGFTLKFHEYQSETFGENLSYVDSQLPINFAKVVLESYVHDECKAFAEICERIFPPQNKSSEQPLFKFREFLGAVSMGLRPSSEWKGNASKFKGLMIVKQDGNVLFYYMNSRLNFEEYLYQNVRFDRPSTKRHAYGYLFNDGISTFIKLNAQIRFRR